MHLPRFPQLPNRCFNLGVTACLALLLAFAHGTHAAADETAAEPTEPKAQATEPNSQPEKSVGGISPNKQFAFLETYNSDDSRNLDLIEQKTGKILARVSDEEKGWHVLWSPDSRRFALMTRLGHPIQVLDVYVRHGDDFRRIKLPVTEAKIPSKITRGKPHPHVANLNWTGGERWNKDGSLVVTIETMFDGAGESVEATRTVVLAIDRSPKARIVKSTIKYKREEE